MKRDKLSAPADCGFVQSYWLTSNHLTIYLFGVFPRYRISLHDVEYLRLASSDEVPRLFYFRNWKHFTPRRAAQCPVYALKIKRGQKVFLKLRAGAHFRLRRVLGQERLRTIEDAARALNPTPAASPPD